MKWFIASDIHGSAYYCSKMLEAYRQEKAERLLLLGDILYHGPRNDLPEEYDPKSVIAMLNEMKNDILCVRGNCDTEVDQMVLSFPIMADYALVCTDTYTIYATHGHVFNDSNLPPLHSDDILLHGHTHIPRCDEKDGILYLNPGSVSLPKENTEHSYMTLENNLLKWKNMDSVTYKEHILK